MMTLDEAIEHAREVAHYAGCKECEEEHEQLAKWLEELRDYRKTMFAIGDIIKEKFGNGDRLVNPYE